MPIFRLPERKFEREIAAAVGRALGESIEDASDHLLDRDWVTAISHLRAQASWNGTTPGEDSLQAVYNPPPGWVILQTQTDVHSSSNGGGSVSVLAQGLNLITETELDQAYDAAINVAAAQGNDEIKARLEERRTEHKIELRRWQSSHNSLVAEAHAKAHGSTLDRKRGWHEITVKAEIMRIGTSGQEVMSLLEHQYGIDIPGV